MEPHATLDPRQVDASQTHIAPEELDISFVAFGKEFDLKLRQIKNLFSPTTETIVYGLNDTVIERRPHPSRSYSTNFPATRISVRPLLSAQIVGEQKPEDHNCTKKGNGNGHGIGHGNGNGNGNGNGKGKGHGHHDHDEDCDDEDESETPSSVEYQTPVSEKSSDSSTLEKPHKHKCKGKGKGKGGEGHDDEEDCDDEVEYASPVSEKSPKSPDSIGSPASPASSESESESELESESESEYQGDDETGSNVAAPKRINTNQSPLKKKKSKDWATATYLGDGTIHSLIYVDGELYQIDAIKEHAADITDDDNEKLKAVSMDGMVIYRMSDVVDGVHSPQAATAASSSGPSWCGTMETAARSAVDPTTTTTAGKPTTPASSDSHNLRRLLVEQWDGCFKNDTEAPMQLSVGVAVDPTYYKLMGSDITAVQTQVAAMFADSNMVYLNQVNVFLQVGQLIIKTKGGSPNWAYDNNCAGIETVLGRFTDWRKTEQRDSMGLWHLITNCWPPPGTIGLAWIGVLCNAKSGTGVTSATGASTWVTVAHELGHNFGAMHSFEEGQGRTGGIMDYGDGLLNGMYQFNTKYRKSEMCSEIRSSMTYGSIPNCWSPYEDDTSFCGNSIIDGFEECDDLTDECCVNCRVDPNCGEGGDDGNGDGDDDNGDDRCDSCSWRVTEWSKCSEDCGGGTRTRDAECVEEGWFWDEVVADSQCPTTKPETEEACNAEPCPEDGDDDEFEWEAGNWRDCNATCGGGVRTRAVRCVEKGFFFNSVVEDAKCQETRPVSEEPCNQSPCDEGDDDGDDDEYEGIDYEWRIKEWSECTKACDGGTRNRVVECIVDGYFWDTVVSDNKCQDVKPKTKEACNEGPCVGEWALGEWGYCSVICGGGTRTREATCEIEGTEVDERVCTDGAAGAKPEVTEECNTGRCLPFQWAIGKWTECSKSCGSGEQTREVKCVSWFSIYVQDLYCRLESKPATSQRCNTFACGSEGDQTLTETQTDSRVDSNQAAVKFFSVDHTDD